MRDDKEIWPNFFIVGAPRAGTTSLYEYLKRVPGVFMPSLKEPHYFSYDSLIASDTETKNLYAKNNIQVVSDRSEYLKLYEPAKQDNSVKAIGDASTTYLFARDAPKRIHDIAPDARIIISLRDPIEAAFSQYLIQKWMGFETMEFYDALLRDYTRLRKGHNSFSGLIERGFYSYQLKRYFDVFDRGQVKIIIFEVFAQKPKETISEILDFLSVTAELLPDNIGRVYNASEYYYNKSRQLSTEAEQEHRSSLKDILKKFHKNTNVNSTKPKMPRMAKLFLKGIYRDDAVQVEDLLGRSLPWPLLQG